MMPLTAMMSDLPRGAALLGLLVMMAGSCKVFGIGGGEGGKDAGPPTRRAEWVRTFLGSQQSASSVGIDAEGNIYVGGTFEAGMIDPGGSQLDCPVQAGADTWCGFVLKLDPMGNTLWSRALGADHTLSIDVT